MQTLQLHPGKEKRILRGHRWIFSNEISSRLAEFEPGGWVEAYSSKGVLLGSGYINPQSLIAVRLLCRPGQEPSREFFLDLLQRAVSRRSELFYPGSRTCRAVYGESDGLPGLIVDRYGDVVVYQITTLGMSRMEPLIQELLIEIFQPRALISRNDSSVRALEGLPFEKKVVFGELPEPCWFELDGLEFQLAPLEGQKTGFYLDQRENRKALTRWTRGKKVLDLFCYNGAWSVVAAAAGAERVLGVDQSARALAQARNNAVRNGVESLCDFKEQDVFGFLKTVEKGSFDVVVLDPPAFAKTRATLPEAQKGYIDLNRRALLCLKPGAILVTCSCSYHLGEGLFREILLHASHASGRQVRILEARGQAVDHPVLLAMPETDYLKCLFLEVI